MRDHERANTRSLISSLGYCCPYAFIRLFKQTGLIAARLGCSERTVRWWKAKFKTKAIVCEQRSCCQLAEIRRIGK
jgi:hypothetical protein